MKTGELIRTAKALVQDVTGFPAENVTGLERDDDGTWVVTLEVLEVERVPNTMDLLGTYEVGLDSDGELQGLRRTRRYPRGASQDGNG
jgi:hypothetical protein